VIRRRQIDVGPAKRGKLAAAHPTSDHERDQRPMPGLLGFGKELRDRRGFVRFASRRSTRGMSSSRKLSETLRTSLSSRKTFERRVQQTVHMPDGLSAEGFTVAAARAGSEPMCASPESARFRRRRRRNRSPSHRSAAFASDAVRNVPRLRRKRVVNAGRKLTHVTRESPV
jgi:hypothetical protein